jgi:transcriptional regulator with XRE-family HTH domain
MMFRIGTKAGGPHVVKVPTVGEVVGRHVRSYRKKLGWTQQDLADETSKLGHPINRVTLAKLEAGGTRAANVSLVDTMVLAAALSVPPPLLFLPLGEEDLVAITPAVKVHPHLVLDWVTGEEPFTNSNRIAQNVKTWHEHSTPMWLFQTLRKLSDATSAADTQRSFAEDDPERFAVANERLDGALRQLDQHLAYMERHGLRVPQLPPEWEARIEELRSTERGARR